MLMEIDVFSPQILAIMDRAAVNMDEQVSL